jgi:hypothetical protein
MNTYSAEDQEPDYYEQDYEPECVCGRGEGCDCDGMEAKAAEDELDYE